MLTIPSTLMPPPLAPEHGGGALCRNELPLGTQGFFIGFMAEQARAGHLVVQPRMGFSRIEDMALALKSVAALDIPVIGTITLDSFTRVGDLQAARECLESDVEMNGFPICTHSSLTTRKMLEEVLRPTFPIQVRHGTAKPQAVFRRMAEIGIDAGEGGPVSYCMPYSRVPLREAALAWADACQILAQSSPKAHLESFGGCLLGQLCPPSLLIATALLEAMFFRQHGINSVSLSYAQGTSPIQDRGALLALQRLAESRLGGDWHIVIYTYMGVFPSSAGGACRLIEDSARLARDGGAARLIVKTAAESRQIPQIADNIDALRCAAGAAQSPPDQVCAAALGHADEIEAEALALIDAALELHSDIGQALVQAFQRGLLDIPYCLHRDNVGRTETYIDEDSTLRWASYGNLPIPRSEQYKRRSKRSSVSETLLTMLHHVANRYDAVPDASPG